MRLLALCLVVCVTPVAADPRPTLDDFYERTRTRDEGFDRCIGYCDGTWLVNVVVGVQSANPSVDATRPVVATGARLGLEAGVRGEANAVARTRLWLDVLRVHGSGEWLTDAAWELTAFETLGSSPRPGDAGVHLALDAVVGRRTELRPSDARELQREPYDTVDTEGEVALIGPKIDKDGHVALPIGVANRLRRGLDGGPLERRTAISGALAIRGFAKRLRNHAQLDVARVKYTSWDVIGGRASATTLSAGYQRLPVGIDTLPLWALVGYQWAGERGGAVVQLGMDLSLETPYGELTIAPEFARHLELDRTIAAFRRVTAGRVALRHRLRHVAYGVTYEAAAIEAGGPGMPGERFHTVTPEVAVIVYGFELGVQYRVVLAGEMTVADRFAVAVDHRF